MRISTVGPWLLKSLILAVFIIVIEGGGVTAQTFSDGTFNDADWTSIVLPCGTPGSGVTAVQDTLEGNPPRSRRVTHHYLPGGVGVLIAHIRRGASFNPPTQGAITGIDYSYDLRHYTGPAQWAVGYSPLLVQNGSYFRIGTWDAIFANQWQTFRGAALPAESFVKICGAGPEYLDFSCTASRIDFGFLTNNSNPNIGAPVEDRSSGIDNWMVTLRPAAPALVIQARPDTVICVGDSVHITASGGVSYHWHSTGSLPCVDCDTFAALPSGATTYVVEAIDINGCRRVDSIRITVTQPHAATRTDLAVCRGEGLTLPSAVGSHYRWTPAASLNCDICRNPIARPTVGTVYTVTVNIGGCIRVDTVAVQVLPLPQASVTGNASICHGDSTVLGVSGGRIYHWSPTVGLSCADCRSPVARPDITTLYHVHVVDSNGCGADDSLVVQVLPPPMISVTGNVSICHGDSTMLSASGGRTYHWSPTVGLSCADCRSPIVHPDVTTLYHVHGVDSNGCGADDSVLVQVLSPPLVSVTGNVSICRGGNTVLGASGGRAYQWSPSIGLSCADCHSPNAHPDVTTLYHVHVVDFNGCSADDSVLVQVLSPPLISITGNVSICHGDSTVLGASGGSLYQWSPTVGLSCADCPSPVAHPDVTTLYHVHGVDSNGCGADDSVVVQVFPPPSIAVTGNVSICHGDSTMLTASGGRSYRWSPLSGLSCADCPSPIVHPDITTLYHVHITDSNGCVADDSVRVEVKESAAITIRIARDLSVRPGDILRFPVLLEGASPSGVINRFDFGLTYWPDILRVDSLLLDGTLCQGWTVSNLVHDRAAGRTTARLTAPPGIWLTGPGMLVEVVVTAYVGSATASELPVIFTPSITSCLSYQTLPGHLRLDSLCGLSYRLIELIKGSYGLDGNRPNPFNPTTTIAFSLGLDGPTTLEVYNAVGVRVAPLIDSYLAAGHYEAVWDASSRPSGIYYYQIHSGAWSQRASMVVVK